MENHELKRLLQEIRAGKSGAFDGFYHEFGRRLVPFFRHHLGFNLEDAEDLAQETVLKIWTILRQGTQRFDSVGSLKKYVAIAARSVAIDWIRRSRLTIQDVRLDDEHGVRTLQTLESTSRVHEQVEASQELQAALDELSTKQRRALILYERDGRSYIEIAQLEGCTVAAVRSRLEEAREKIAKRLAGQHDVSEP